MAYPLEARLRPAHELGAASVSALGAALVFSSPGLFLVSPPWHLALAGVLLGHAAWRGAAGLQTLRYRANLRRRRRYELGSADIPWSADGLFLGRGFRWDQRHTQRLFEARLPANRPLLQCGPLAGALAAFTPPADEFGGVGGDPAIHGVEPDESEIWMDLEDRVGHTLVLGTTRVGKTRLAELLIAQDIRRGEVVIVFDPKGDVDLLRRVFAEAERAGRGGEFFMFHLGHPDISARYNPVGSFSRITEVATRIAGQLPSEGQSAAFKEFVWRFVNVMARALVALGRKPDYQEINRYASDVEPLLIDYFEYWLDREPAAAGWREELRSLTIDKKNLDKGLQSRGARAVSLVEYARRKKLYDPIAHALASTLNYEKSHFDKLVASLLPLMEKLTTGRTASLLSPELDDPTEWRPVFDWTSVINLGGIVYVGLDALSDYEVAAAVGNSMFADLTSVAGSLYKFGAGRGLPGEVTPRRIAIHADEFNELIGDEFIPLLNKAGGAGFQVTAYTQTWSDVEARIGSPAKAGQIAGNFNTLIMLRVKEVATAELLTSQLPEVHVVSTVVSSSVTGSALHTDWQRVVRLRRQSHELPEDPAGNARPARSRSGYRAGMRMRLQPSAQTAGREREAMPSACDGDDVASCAAVVLHHDPCVSLRVRLNRRSVVASKPRAGALGALCDGRTDRWSAWHSIRRPRQEPGRATRPVPAHRKAARGHLGPPPRKSYHCARAPLIAIADMPTTAFPRSSIARLAWIALAAANAVFAADLIEIAWSPSGRFERTVSVAAGRFAEICGKLDQGEKVAWRFVAEPAMAFNVHYHVGKDVVYPAKRESETQLTGNLVAPVTQDYCWMWSNKTTGEGRVTVTLER